MTQITSSQAWRLVGCEFTATPKEIGGEDFHIPVTLPFLFLRECVVGINEIPSVFTVAGVTP